MQQGNTHLEKMISHRNVEGTIVVPQVTDLNRLLQAGLFLKQRRQIGKDEFEKCPYSMIKILIH